MNTPSSGSHVILATADAGRRDSLKLSLTGMRWRVIEAKTGAEAIACLERQPSEALLIDNWLPDLEVQALAKTIGQLYPSVDVLRFDGTSGGTSRSARRHELLQALRELSGQCSQSDPAWERQISKDLTSGATRTNPQLEETAYSLGVDPCRIVRIPELVGNSVPMQELTQLIQLAAPHNVRVLIEGETGTGKELVAKALHKFSGRSRKPFVVLNCAAIPEALLEAELFGHTRGAFTGATQSRVGRIEAAHGGTLFLDEIGEMPMTLQAKLLRFLENGELQRVGNNELVHVDVRVISATHQNLDICVEKHSFRLDLLHRLAVFPIQVPRLADRMEDLPLLAEHLLQQLTKDQPRKRLSEDALHELTLHSWPGNVRELAHVLQRASILSGGQAWITSREIKMRRSERGKHN